MKLCLKYLEFSFGAHLLGGENSNRIGVTTKMIGEDDKEGCVVVGDEDVCGEDGWEIGEDGCVGMEKPVVVLICENKL